MTDASDEKSVTYCTECGRKNSLNYIYCVKCGERLVKVVPASSSPAPAPAPTPIPVSIEHFSWDKEFEIDKKVEDFPLVIIEDFDKINEEARRLKEKEDENWSKKQYRSLGLGTSMWFKVLGIVILLGLLVPIPLAMVWTYFQEQETEPRSSVEPAEPVQAVPEFSPPPANLVLQEPTYRGSVDNIFRDGRRLWWRSEYFACVAVFGENVSPVFIPGQLISRGDWAGWQFAELRGEGNRYLFLSVCGTGWNTYISKMASGISEHFGQAVTRDEAGRRAYQIPP